MPYNPSTGIYSLPAVYLAIPGTVIIAVQHNTPLEDLETAQNYARPVIAGGTGATTGAGAATNLNVLSLSGGDMGGNTIANPALLVQQGYIYGCHIANNGSDAVNDIDFGSGRAADASTAPPVLMNLSPGITKRLDASWTVGTNQGGLDTGAVADGSYHCYIIRRPDTGVVDCCFSASASAPTTGVNIPAAYTQYRRIGSIIRAGGTILAFGQGIQGIFLLGATRSVTTSTADSTADLDMLTPTGINAMPIFSLVVTGNGTIGTWTGSFGDNVLTSSAKMPLLSISTTLSTVRLEAVCWGAFRTNTSRQLRRTFASSVGTLNALNLDLWGWIDDRGQLT